MTAGRPTVLIVQEWIPRYRVDFFGELRRTLDRRGVDLELVHGQPPADRSARADSVVVPWATSVRNRTLDLRGRRVTWQPALQPCRAADLIIVAQDVSLLLGPLLLLASRLRLVAPVAVWGHGENIRASERSSYAEFIKRWVSRLAHWFFAYTEYSATLVSASGFTPKRITVVNNSRSAASVGAADSVSDDVEALVGAVSGRTTRVGWIISALDGTKRLDTLVEMADEVRRLVPDFEFLVVGGGPGEAEMRRAAATRPWMHVLGPRFGADRQTLGGLAQVTLHPGLIGLHVIDSFEFRAPVVTAHMPDHSHEMTYLEDGVNARVLEAGSSATELGRAASEVLSDDELRALLQQGCAESRDAYSLTAMVDRFAEGVEKALAAPR